MTSATSAVEDERLLLHGVADVEAVRIIGPRVADFAGLAVRAIQEGRVVALVSMPPRPVRLPRWLAWLPRPPEPSMLPVVSAISSMIPLLPVALGTVFENEETLRQMLRSRESEIAELIADHSGFLECDVTATFDAGRAESDISQNEPIIYMRAETETENALVAQAVNQSVAGRRGSFFARLRRRIEAGALDVLPLDGDATGESAADQGMNRRILVARENRSQVRSSLVTLAAEVGAGAKLKVSAYRPAFSFRRLEIASADANLVSQARAALGVEESTERSAIRLAYQRTIERCCSHAADKERHQRFMRLEQLFGLLDRVADGQLKAARGETQIRLDPESLKGTWLLRFHMHDLADRAA